MTTSALQRGRQFIPFIACLTACSGSVPDVDQAQTTPVAPRVAIVAEPRPSAQLNQQDAIEALTGGRTRAVWIRDLGDGTDILGFGDQVLVMGFDTGDDLGERAIVDSPGTYAKPLITPRGDRVVYTNRRENSVRVVDWSGEHARRVIAGFPLAVWIDPDTGLWVILLTNRTWPERGESAIGAVRATVADLAAEALHNGPAGTEAAEARYTGPVSTHPPD